MTSPVDPDLCTFTWLDDTIHGDAPITDGAAMYACLDVEFFRPDGSLQPLTDYDDDTVLEAVRAAAVDHEIVVGGHGEFVGTRRAAPDTGLVTAVFRLYDGLDTLSEIVHGHRGE